MSDSSWVEHAVACHSNKAHDDFYDMIGEGLYDLHSTYYPNCDDALEFYIEEGARDGDTMWLFINGLLMDVKGYPQTILEAAARHKHLIFFYGPPELERPALNTNGLVHITSVVVNGYPEGFFPDLPSDGSDCQGQSETGVETPQMCSCGPTEGCSEYAPFCRKVPR